MNNGKPGEGGTEKLLAFFCRHLVALCITYRRVKCGIPVGDQIFSAYPGVVICIRGTYSFLTAGHALKDITAYLEKGDIAVVSAVLADTFGPDAISEKPIPFDLLNEPRFFIDDTEEGLDFGLIALRPYYVALLVKHGITVLFEENWIAQHRVKFDAYAMLGLPEEFVSYEKDGQEIVGKVSPTMIWVKAIDIPPEGTKRTTYPRFIGKLAEDLPLSSVVGMSGGPIFGFRYGPPTAYWVVAIQSSWLENQRVVFACPLPVLAKLLTTWIDDLSNSGDFQSFGAEERNEDFKKRA
jgi:hypothetical protein